MAGKTVLLALAASVGARAARLETKEEMIAFLRAHPSRAYFSRLIRDGPYDVAMEVGVADGRFSEHFLRDAQPKTWYMVEPFPNKQLQARFWPWRKEWRQDPLDWASRGIGTTSRLRFFKALSLDKAVLDAVPPESVDFIYLDGAHDYANVARELEPYYRMLRPGGMLAGHDYCNYGERPLPCRGCADVPACVTYTEYGIAHGKGNKRASNQNGVVKAVQEWLVGHPELEAHHTIENFTRTSLAQDGMDYDLVITNTYNPSWYVFKPEKGGTPVLGAPVSTPAATPAAPTSDIRDTTGKPCAAATVLPFEATRPFDPEAELLRPNEACPGRIHSVHRVPKRASEILTIGYLYYRDAKALAEKVEYWKTFDESLLAKTHFLVVDDGSPPAEAAAPVSPARKSKARKVSPKARPPQVVEAGAAGSAARVTVVAIDQDLVWNIAGARNLIFAVAPTDVVLLMDMDYGVPSGLVVWALGQVPSVARSCVVLGGFPRDFRFEHERRASRHTGKRHPGVQLMSRRAYWHVGGNDEDLVGHYGHTDPTFHRKVGLSTCEGRGAPSFVPKLMLAKAGSEGARHPRNARHNGIIAGKKVGGSLPWATDVLRFSWHVAFPAA